MMKNGKDKGMCECGGMGGSCHRCWGMIALVLGVLVLLNANYGMVSWAMFVGIILVVKGLVKMIWPHCPHC